MSDYLKVGPETVDDAGELGKSLGVHNQATELIESVRANYPPELITAMSRPENPGRTRTLDLDEIIDIASEAFPSFKRLVSAAVRGTESMMVSLAYESESGRIVKAAIPYEDCPKSAKKYAKAPVAETTSADDSLTLRAELEAARAEIAELKGEDPVEPEGPEFPYDGYSDNNGDEVIAVVEEADEEMVEAIAEAEAEGKGRKGVTEAVEARRVALSEDE